MNKDELPNLPRETQRYLWEVMHEMALPELLLLMRIYHGLEWRGDKTDLFVLDLVELLLELKLVLQSQPGDQLTLTPCGMFLAKLVAAVWPGKPRAAGTPLPAAKPKPRPKLQLVVTSR